MAYRKRTHISAKLAAASALGVTLTTYQQMERGASYATGKPMAIDRRTALACAAIRAGIAPEGEA